MKGFDSSNINSNFGYLQGYNMKTQCYEKLANFRFIPTRIIIEYSSSGQEQIKIAVDVHIHPTGYSNSIELSVQQYKKIAQYIVNTHVNAYVTSSSFADLINTYAAQITDNIPCEYLYTASGWTFLPNGYANSTPTYLYNGLQWNYGKCQCDDTLVFLNQDAPTQLYLAMEFLHISSDLSKTLPLWLFSHLGVLTQLFDSAGYPIRFLLYIKGGSGSLKTAISKVVFRITQEMNFLASFNDTLSAIEIKMQKAKDKVLLIDDFHPATSAGEKKKETAKLESIVRFFGDGVGKARAASNLEKFTETAPRCVCAITGEDVEGTQSSFLRCFFVNVESGTYDGNILKYFQDNPYILPGHIAQFILWAQANYNFVLQIILNCMPQHRQILGRQFKEKRLVDAGACFLTVAEILQQYTLFITNGTAQIDFAAWQGAIFQAMRECESEYHSETPAAMYVKALLTRIDSGKLIVAENKSVFGMNTQAYAGFYENNHLYIKPSEADTHVHQYFSLLGKIYPLNEKMAHKALEQAGCLLAGKEGDKPLRVHKVYINGKQQRMLKFDWAAMQKLLDESESY